MSLRLSATLLESFRLYINDLVDNEAEVISTIKREQLTLTPEQWKRINVGHAFHSTLEHPQRTLLGRYECEGFQFDAPVIESVLERLGPGVFETKIVKTLSTTTAGEPIDLVAKADHIAGLNVSEFKGPIDGIFNAEKYADSYQWRVMCLTHEATKVTYHIACLKEDDECFRLKSLDSMDLYPYPQLENDVKNLIRELLRFAQIRRLDSYLRWEPKPAELTVTK